ncbi:uncharacterized protein LOC119112633 [Pollicipes pollicipes]|uniref:uncharacterized protein LOC119112633 n=1 Tax=Pollicipes pollicipes TaxID=41117 RepID=UPI0018855DC1|nr:uncharacterized protein LOC119112633 [Pollicipes pollicipes]XP_037092757.1 uncharacterized protein LOC119112633 [Pollicipes pollicipes]
MKRLVWLTAVWTLMLQSTVDGHGRLQRPPCRASLWRYSGYDTPADYNDNQLFCGGLTHQVAQGGKCGICGDPYDEPVPRTHEIGGPYYRGYLVANYTAGSAIDVQVLLTANHKGYFQFKICPVPGFTTEATQECLDRHVLRLAGSDQTEYPIRPEYKEVRVRLQLPDGLTCEHCVFQWRYHAGNSWGVCEDGSQAAGCGPQEEFYGCSDVTIHPGGRTYSPRPTRRPTTERPATRATTTSRRTRPPTRATARPSAGPGSVCRSVGPWSTLPGMDAWCQLNCHHLVPYCPPTHCRCYDEEVAALRDKPARRP